MKKLFTILITALAFSAQAVENIAINRLCNPRFLQQVDEIPKNNAGKVSRTLLKELYS